MAALNFNPRGLLPTIFNVPLELRQHDQWVAVDMSAGSDGHPRKFPINPRTGALASVTDPSTWGSFEEAYMMGGAVGFVLADSDPFTIIDLDNKPNKPATPEQLARHDAIRAHFDSYQERSSSGTGYHIIVKGAIPQGVHRDNVEMYSRGRYMIMTGDAVHQVPAYDYHDDIVQMCGEMRPRNDVELKQVQGTESDQTIVDRGQRASNGEKFSALMRGDWQSLNEYPSQSEADSALLSMLCFYTPDNAQVQRIFNASGMYRAQKGAAYAMRTITYIRSNEDDPEVSEAEWKAKVEHGKWLMELLVKNAIAKEEARKAAAVAEAVERFHLYSAEELMQLPPMEWAIKGVLPREGVCALFGESGAGKSFLTLDMCAAIAGEQEEWFGHRVKHMPVTYIALEGVQGTGKRLSAWQKNRGRPMPRDLRFITSHIDLMNEDDISALVDKLKTSGLVGSMTVIDTLARATAGVDENKAQDMSRVIANVSRIQREIGGTVLLVHHARKSEDKAIRGHSSLFAALDSVIQVERKVDDDTGESTRTWRLSKSKDDADGELHAFELEVANLGLDSDGDTITSCSVKSAALPTPTPKPQIDFGPSGARQKRAYKALVDYINQYGVVDQQFGYGNKVVTTDAAINAIALAFPEQGVKAKSVGRHQFEALINGSHITVNLTAVWVTNPNASVLG